MSNNHHQSHNHQTMGEQNFLNKINFLDGAMRKKTLPPEDILDLLPIKEKSNILDAGAGSGYLTIPAAKRTDGMVYALDIDFRMLNVVGSRAESVNITNIQLLQGSIDGIPLAANSVDIILASLILHELESLPAAFMQMSRVLKTEGYFLCMEYEKEESTVQGPPMDMRISSADMEESLISAGFDIAQKLFPGKSIYIITAKKKGLYNEDNITKQLL